LSAASARAHRNGDVDSHGGRRRLGFDFFHDGRRLARHDRVGRGHHLRLLEKLVARGRLVRFGDRQRIHVDSAEIDGRRPIVIRRRRREGEADGLGRSARLQILDDGGREPERCKRRALLAARHA
jgi:hypothetical protein